MNGQCVIMILSSILIGLNKAVDNILPPVDSSWEQWEGLFPPASKLGAVRPHPLQSNSWTRHDPFHLGKSTQTQFIVCKVTMGANAKTWNSQCYYFFHSSAFFHLTVWLSFLLWIRRRSFEQTVFFWMRSYWIHPIRQGFFFYSIFHSKVKLLLCFVIILNASASVVI